MFFTALAIADDLGAVLVIAIFYSSDINWIALAVAGVFFLALIVLNRSRVRQPLPYVLLGIGLWLAVFESGIHPTIAGVLLAMTIPARIDVEAEAYLAQTTAVLQGARRGVGSRWRQRGSERVRQRLKGGWGNDEPSVLLSNPRSARREWIPY